MDNNFELYDGKSFKDLCKDIIVNQSNRKEQIEIFISDLRPMIKTINDAMQVVPLIKQYIDAGISNDEHLVKLAQICQRIMSAAASEAAGGGNSYSLTDKEKKELMDAIEETKQSGIEIDKIINDSQSDKK